MNILMAAWAVECDDAGEPSLLRDLRRDSGGADRTDALANAVVRAAAKRFDAARRAGSPSVYVNADSELSSAVDAYDATQPPPSAT